MISEAIVQQLRLIPIKNTGNCCQQNRRCFLWPEFEVFQATIRECGINGLRLPKNNQLVVVYVKNEKERRLILTNDQLENQTYGLRHRILYS